MLAIAVCDVVGHLAEFYGILVDRKIVNGARKVYMERSMVSHCDQTESFMILELIPNIVHFLKKSASQISIWLTIVMISSTRAMETSRRAIFSNFFMIFWVMLYYGCDWFLVRRMWYQKEGRELFCTPSPNLSHVFVYPAHFFNFIRVREEFDPLFRVIPIFIYPFLWIHLLLENRKANSQNFKSSGIQLFLVIMTLTILSEGLTCVLDCVSIFIRFGPFSEEFKISLAASVQVGNWLKCLNSMSHCIVCYVWSIQYRNTVKRIFGCGGSREKGFRTDG